LVVRGTPLPKKLRRDSIVEAVFEMQFETPTIAERLIGRMTDLEPWKNLPQRRLPEYEVPAMLRQTNPFLRFRPTVEVPDDQTEEYRSIRIGPNVLSYHCAKKYVGWSRFKPELERTVVDLFNAAESIRIVRLGLRYLNAFTPTAHNINSVADLDMSITVAEDKLTGNVNLNYQIDLPEIGQCRVGIATRQFVQGPLPDGTTVYVDVDVFTIPGYECSNADEVKVWLEKAHDQEKEEFFHLMKKETIDALTED
jgi:uncharacterized protein (TIGR04255 family)